MVPSLDPESWIDQMTVRLGVSHLYPYQILVMFHLARSMGLLDSQEAAESVLCLFPTGMGKTLCFMGPLAFSPGISVVVYPLNALLHDQQRRFQSLGIPALVLQGGQTSQERRAILAELEQSPQMVILTNPETLLSPALDSWWTRVQIKNLVVDEVHLVDQWGADFRPLFRELGEFRRFWGIPCLGAFSATVSDQSLTVLKDCLFSGDMLRIIRAPLDRPNIYFSALPCYSSLEILPLLFSPLASLFDMTALEQPAIIFTPTRKSAERCALYLRQWIRIWGRLFIDDSGNPISPPWRPEDCQAYHAGLTKDERCRLEAWFFKQETGILSATCAYGTGIDKPNIRTVVHLTAPRDPQAYVQESGRGGRDGKPALALLLLEPGAPNWTLDYSRADQCRRAWLTAQLSDDLEGCAGCDSCDERKEYTVPLEWRLIEPLFSVLGSKPTEQQIHSCIASGFLAGVLQGTETKLRTLLAIRLLQQLPWPTIRQWLRLASEDGFLKRVQYPWARLFPGVSVRYNVNHGKTRIFGHRN